MSENNDLNTLSGDEIELLFPWYIAGTLDEPDRRRVEAYLEAHPEAAAQLELIREEQEETILSNESLGSPSAAALGRLMHEINADSAKPSLTAQAKSSIMGVLDNFIAGLSPGGCRICRLAVDARHRARWATQRSPRVGRPRRRKRRPDRRQQPLLQARHLSLAAPERPLRTRGGCRRPA